MFIHTAQERRTPPPPLGCPTTSDLDHWAAALGTPVQSNVAVGSFLSPTPCENIPTELMLPRPHM